MGLAFLIIPLLALVLYLIHRASDKPIFQYLFFLRIPILSAIFLLAYAWIATGPAESLLANTLVLLKTRGFFLVILTGVLIAGMAQLVTLQIVENAPERFGVKPFDTNRFVKIVVTSWWTLPVVLPIPLIISLYTNSDTLSPLTRILAALGALALGLILIGLVNLRTFGLPLANRFAGWLAGMFGTDSAITKGYIVEKDGKMVAEPGHAKLISLTIVVLILYILVGFFFRLPVVGLPALFYVLLLVLLLGFLVSGITFFLDFFRIPSMVFLLLAVILIFNLARIDHFYKLSEATGEAIAESDRELYKRVSQTVQRANEYKQSKDLKQQVATAGTEASVFNQEEAQAVSDAANRAQDIFVEALRNRLADQPADNRTLVVVGASGGGIQAAGWTTQILSGLHLHPDFGPEFARAIGMISSVSGGSMGNMFYVDRLRELDAAAGDQQKMVEIVEAMRRGSMGNALDDTAWGITYPDFLRVLGFGVLFNPLVDRAYGLESFLASQMADGDARMLRDWRQAVIDGDLPTTVFNSTLVETGDRFLLSPMDFPTATNAEALTGYYPGYDMDVVTGARLSATFPYVTPVARPYFEGQGRGDCGADNPEDCYHVADGGYFDNFGIFTIVEWLDNVILPVNDRGLNIKRVILIQINAFPLSETPTPNMTGFQAALLGPAMALANVRNSTQTARNKAEVAFLTRQWSGEVKVDYVDLRFQLSGDPQPCDEIDPPCPSDHEDFNDFNPPLSWKLSPRQKEAICKAWTKMVCGGGLDDLKAAWQSRNDQQPAPKPPQPGEDTEM